MKERNNKGMALKIQQMRFISGTRRRMRVCYLSQEPSVSLGHVVNYILLPSSSGHEYVVNHSRSQKPVLPA